MIEICNQAFTEENIYSLRENYIADYIHREF